MIDESFKKDSGLVTYKVKVYLGGKLFQSINTDYVIDALDIRDNWIAKGMSAGVFKVTTERIEL